MTESVCRRLPVLDAAEAVQWSQAVLDSRSDWRARRSDVPFHTLGTASYLDASAGAEVYVERARQSNPLLASRFGALIERLRAAMQRSLDAPVRLARDKALPGFHVFGAAPAFERPFASIHADRQYRGLDWSHEGVVDEEHTLSVTLPLCLPASGGGLRLWPLDGRKIETLDAEQRRALLAQAPPVQEQSYTVGEAVLHDGHLLHQIAPLRAAQTGEWRITLQAHALRFDGVWHLYW